MTTKLITQTYQQGRDWPLPEFAAAIAWLQVKLDEIPAEHRDTATIDFGCDSIYGDHYDSTITISYQLPETPKDIAMRERDEADMRERVRAKELQELSDDIWVSCAVSVDYVQFQHTVCLLNVEQRRTLVVKPHRESGLPGLLANHNRSEVMLP